MGNWKLYTDEGWINAELLIKCRQPFVFMVSARQLGKTYSTLKYCVENKIRFAYVRRTASIVDTITSEAMSVFKELNEKEGWDIHAEKDANNIYIWKDENDETVGYTFSAMSVSKMRGFSGIDIKVVIYDEFITELHEKRIRGEFDAFMNMYSTINRNRDIQGEPPLKMICLANSNNIVSPILLGMNISEIFEKLERSQKEVEIDYKRGIMCIMCKYSPISKRLQNSALYKAAEGTDFSKMAFSNEFAYNDRKYIKKLPVIEFIPICSVGPIVFMRHKSQPLFYCCRKNIECGDKFGNSVADQKRFVIKYARLYGAMIQGLMYFDSSYSYDYYLSYLKGV